MWPFAKQSARRKEIRRSRAERGLGWHLRLTGRLLLPNSVTALSGLVAAVIVNLGGDVLDIRVGQTLPRAVTSRVEFSVENQARTIEKRIEARDNAENYYELDDSLLQDIRGRLTNALQLAKEHAADPEAFRAETRQAKIVLDDAGRTELLRIANLSEADELQRATERFQAAVDAAIRRLASEPPLFVEALGPAQRRTAANAILVTPHAKTKTLGPPERSVSVTNLRTSNRPEAAEAAAEAAVAPFSEALRASMKASILEMLREEPEGTFKPIYRYLPEESARAAQSAYDRVPIHYDTYARFRQLAGTGAVTEDEARLLRAEHEAHRRWVAEGGKSRSPAEWARLQAEDPAGYKEWLEARAAWRAHWLAAAGYAFLTLLVTVGLSSHLAQVRQSYRLTPWRRLIAAVMLLALLGAARAVFAATSNAYYAVGTQAFAAALLAIALPHGPVLAVCGSLALLNTLATRHGVGFFLVLLAVSMWLRFGLRDIRSRGRIVAAGAGAALIALIATLAAGLVDGQSLAFVLGQQALAAAATTLAAAFIIEGILPGVERLFKISTSMTLLEWCDASKPLLRMLAAEAPGTYNHSLLVGTLAEAAADAIAANGLLARTASYYHDIGKINKPEYFVENQSLGVSRHDGLSPAMSLLIIIGHVKDGIEMAREYGVPASLHPFIPEHHGTTLVQYFYHAANVQRKPGDREVSDVEFRYPGPKPQSRETAIVMICDGVEGAVRALPEPTPARIEDVVAKVTERRLMDGQFDECELTFRELGLIERTLVKSLCAIYHSRITYPERSEDGRPSEARAS
jgi:putative nucleotidyltransferase with HDIG domain